MEQQIPSGDSQSLVTLYVSSPKALELLAKPSLGKLAEGYIKQKIDIQGSARDAISAITILFRNDRDGKKTILQPGVAYLAPFSPPRQRGGPVLL